ncbi:phosphoacetylglucosamine mutase-like [Lingula anatina]|uniref:Phosphoacetylglucosamine mutase n=1 Tax=Lingula anatina TaxID=7574 RepID=A0A1S3JSQ3_LINAN|nr:phosphoacetylglucosamine mutase-like [Lingula anatina]|eukprot:XP_013413352.1 phosphoacetylglucosamine mutase-like [Lingula anatina]
MFRMGVLAALRSQLKRAVIGAMITASHNPEEDNGVKLVDPLGEMLEAAWEKLATKLANVSDSDLPAVLSDIVSSCGIDTAVPAQVFLARDTRPSSPSLAQAIIDGVQAINGEIKDYGILTTPQLHFMVRCENSQGQYGSQTENGYYTKLSNAFLKLRGHEHQNERYHPQLRLDGANGVGALKIKEMQKHLNNSLQIELFNDGSSGKLNYMCGADYVKVQQTAPNGMPKEARVRCASFDGDADRIVYFYQEKNGTFKLLDGDKIATLVAGYLKELVNSSGLNINLGLVQTAYANGSSTSYITNELQVPVACVPTGVKHLHHKALEYDIGVYFEANGHGTVVFSEKIQDMVLMAANDSSLSKDQEHAARRLLWIIGLINQTVGDAISDLLLVETILHSKGWSIEDWNDAYTDLPNRQLKVKVKDRTVIQTTDAERKTTSPKGLQEAIDALVEKYPDGRAFVRPSGTEDIVRVYAEAETQKNADMLAHEVSVEVYNLAGGVGEKPTPPQ